MKNDSGHVLDSRPHFWLKKIPSKGGEEERGCYQVPQRNLITEETLPKQISLRTPAFPKLIHGIGGGLVAK